jgi:hypothetical protein
MTSGLSRPRGLNASSRAKFENTPGPLVLAGELWVCMHRDEKGEFPHPLGSQASLIHWPVTPYILHVQWFLPLLRLIPLREPFLDEVHLELVNIPDPGWLE